MSEPVCVVEIGTGALPHTGAGLSPAIVVAGLGLLLVGIALWLLRRSSTTAGRAGPVAAVAVPAAPAFASASDTCRLIGVDAGNAGPERSASQDR